MREKINQLADGLKGPSALENEIENIQERADDILENGNPNMMKYRVKMSKTQYVRNWIDSLDVSNHPSVIQIQTVALDMFDNPEKHTCLSKSDIDKIFSPYGEDWGSGSTGGAYGFNKCTIRCIKENMFTENKNTNCP